MRDDLTIKEFVLSVLDMLDTCVAQPDEALVLGIAAYHAIAQYVRMNPINDDLPDKLRVKDIKGLISILRKLSDSRLSSLIDWIIPYRFIVKNMDLVKGMDSFGLEDVLFDIHPASPQNGRIQAERS